MSIFTNSPEQETIDSYFEKKNLEKKGFKKIKFAEKTKINFKKSN